jgi:type VI secretion system secreted protein Hcp
MAFDAFLKIEGIKGESVDAKHKDEIVLESFSWGVANAGAGYAGSAGRATGKSSPSDFSIQKKIDKASPDLFAACASGKHTPTMVLTVRKAGGEPLEYLVYKFADVMVSAYQAGGSAGGDLPVESVSFNYAKVEISYVPQDKTGKGMSPVGTGWDFSSNKKV